MSNMKHSDRFVIGQNAQNETVGEGLNRKILGYNDDLLLARVHFEEGSVGYVHAHPHAQLAFVLSGVFDFTIGDETRRLEAGDCAQIPPNIDHGAVCVEAGELLDIFSPQREDFLVGEQDA